MSPFYFILGGREELKLKKKEIKKLNRLRIILGASLVDEENWDPMMDDAFDDDDDELW